MTKRHQKHKQHKKLKVGGQILLGVFCVGLLSALAWQNEAIKSRVINTFGDSAKYQKEEYEKQKALAAKKYGPAKQSSQTSKKEDPSSQKKSSASSLKESKKNTEYVNYTVRSGDSLTAIAMRYGVSVQDLIQINDLPANGRVAAGEVLRIPDNGERPAETDSSDTGAATTSQSSVAPDSSYSDQDETEAEEESTPTSQTEQTVDSQVSQSDTDE